MYIKNQIAKQAYRVVYLFFCISGILLQYANAAMNGGNSVRMLSAYYTMLTNILCFIYFAYLVVVQPKHENPVIKGAVVMSIILTGLGYHILLAKAGAGTMEGSATPFFAYSNLMVHTITPLMAIIDYFLFTPKGEYKWYDPFYYLIIPTAYCIFAFIRAEVSPYKFYGFNGLSRFPYPFLDIDEFGVGKILLMIFILLIIYLALSFLSFGMDRLLNYINNRIKQKKLAPANESIASANTSAETLAEEEKVEEVIEEKEEDTKE